MKINVTYEQYEQMYKKASKNSASALNILKAFLIGGSICLLGEALMNVYSWAGLSEKTAGTAVSLSLIALSVLLTALGVYDRIAKHGGAGTLVPITGFANSVVSPAMEFKTEGYIYGTAAKMFTVAGPIIVFGVSASVLVGLIYFAIYRIF